LPDDPEKFRKLAAQLLVDKAVLEQELSLVKKRRQRHGRGTDESSEDPDR